MSKPKAYVTREIPRRGLDVIKENFNVKVWQEYAPPSKEVILKESAEVDAVVSLLSDSIDAEVFDIAPKLKIVSQFAVGFDNIEVEEATKRGIYITNTPGVLTETTADFAWALLMAIARRVVDADNYIRTKQWKVGWHPNMLAGSDIYGATIGIIGAGRIGAAMAQRATGFKMRILYYDVISRPDIERNFGAKRMDMNSIMREADFVSVHVPLMKETYKLIDADKLRLMKKTAYLINNSRGPVVDEKALYRAIKEKRIAGAALDVFEQEPTPVANPLLQLDNIIMAPHISSASYETRSKMAEIVSNNLIAFFKGIRPPNLVNPSVMQTRHLQKLF